MVFRAAAIEWAKAGGGSIHGVFRKQRRVGWTRSLHTEMWEIESESRKGSFRIIHQGFA